MALLAGAWASRASTWAAASLSPVQPQGASKVALSCRPVLQSALQHSVQRTVPVAAGGNKLWGVLGPRPKHSGVRNTVVLLM